MQAKSSILQHLECKIMMHYVHCFVEQIHLRSSHKGGAQFSLERVTKYDVTWHYGAESIDVYCVGLKPKLLYKVLRYHRKHTHVKINHAWYKSHEGFAGGRNSVSEGEGGSSVIILTTEWEKSWFFLCNSHLQPA
jgi:hypothetical protein